MDYTEIIIRLPEELSDMLMAELSTLGFESFIQEEGILKAYVPRNRFPKLKEGMETLFRVNATIIDWESGDIPEQNWNENWERDYRPITVMDKVHIRAPFHPEPPEGMMDIIIEPKMSFGTGHHSTTALMVSMMLGLDLSNRQVLDMGSGTGILAILASRLGAAHILAVDNHPWAARNTIENLERNQVDNVTVVEGEEEAISGKTFGTILANINRNVLLDHLPIYASCLEAGSQLLISGFYESDMDILSDRAGECGLEFVSRNSMLSWAVALFNKI